MGGMMNGEPVPDFGTPAYDRWVARIRREQYEQRRTYMLEHPDEEPTLLPFYPEDQSPVQSRWDPPYIFVRLPVTSRWGYDYMRTWDTKAEAVAWWKAADPL